MDMSVTTLDAQQAALFGDNLMPGSLKARCCGCTCCKDKNIGGQGVRAVEALSIPLYYTDDACPLHQGWRGRIEALIKGGKNHGG